MMRQYFGTDGVRGPYGGPVINESFATRLGVAAGRWLQAQGVQEARVLLGRDTRASGPALLRAVATGLQHVGMKPVDLGVVPTPAVARAVRDQGAALGVVVTASHNPAGDNGIKFFTTGGIKLTDAEEMALEQLLPEVVAPADVLLATDDVSASYIAAAGNLLPAGALAGWKIVLDTANGATCGTSPQVLRALGAEVIGIGDVPDGNNINANVGSEHPAQLTSQVVAAGARVGIAHDGDGDRCILSDEEGHVLDGDEVLTILATQALAKGALARDTLVITVQSNMGVDAAVQAVGGRVLRTAVGDRYVGECMRAEGAILGGESSGHIIHADVSPSGDGLVAALKVLAVMTETGEALSTLRGRLRKFPQATAALPVREKRDLAGCRQLSGTIAVLEQELGGNGRVMVRYSGTESKLRLLVEGPSPETVSAAMARLESASRADLDVL